MRVIDALFRSARADRGRRRSGRAAGAKRHLPRPGETVLKAAQTKENHFAPVPKEIASARLPQPIVIIGASKLAVSPHLCFQGSSACRFAVLSTIPPALNFATAMFDLCLIHHRRRHVGTCVKNLLCSLVRPERAPGCRGPARAGSKTYERSPGLAAGSPSGRNLSLRQFRSHRRARRPCREARSSAGSRLAAERRPASA